MRIKPETLVESLLGAEIARFVKQAARNRTCLSADECAAEILHLYPRCGFEQRDIANRVMMAAAAARVPVEIGARARLLEGRPAVQPKAYPQTRLRRVTASELPARSRALPAPRRVPLH
jgi:hypothetical protein